MGGENTFYGLGLGVGDVGRGACGIGVAYVEEDIVTAGDGCGGIEDFLIVIYLIGVSGFWKTYMNNVGLKNRLKS